MNIFKLDIKNDSLFKNIFLRDVGKKYMCSIISELLNLDYEDLLKNIRLYATEHPNNNLDKKSSFSDIIYGYKNKLFIIEMNKSFSKKLVSKNYYYLFFRHTFDANNGNDYNYEKETYLIDIDNFDIVDKMNLNIEKKFIYKSLFQLEDKKISLYKNIQTYRINLDYLKNVKYNYNMLTNIEKDCLTFVEKNKKNLKENIKNKYLEGVMKMLEVVELEGYFFPLYNKEEWEVSLREEAKVLGREEGHKEGHKEGLEQGTINTKLSIAKALKQKSFSTKEIMELTGLTQEEMKSL